MLLLIIVFSYIFCSSSSHFITKGNLPMGELPSHSEHIRFYKQWLVAKNNRLNITEMSITSTTPLDIEIKG